MTWLLGCLLAACISGALSAWLANSGQSKTFSGVIGALIAAVIGTAVVAYPYEPAGPSFIRMIQAAPIFLILSIIFTIIALRKWAPLSEDPKSAVAKSDHPTVPQHDILDVPSSGSPPSNSVEEELEKIEDLYRRSVITDDEKTKMRAKILGIG